MVTIFGIELRRLVRKHFKSLRAFVRKAEPDTDEATAVGHLSKVINGKRPPPFDRVESWADTLGLSGPERQRFIDLAAIAHLPESAQSRFIAVIDEAAAVLKHGTSVREIVADLMQRAATAEHRVAELEHRYRER